MMSPNGRVGFHASYLDNDGQLEESGVGNALVGGYLANLNLSETAIIFATAAGPNELNWLTAENRAAAEINFEDFITADDQKQTGVKAAVADPVVANAPKSNAAVIDALSLQGKKLSSYSLPEMETLLKGAMRNPAIIEPLISAAKFDAAGAATFRAHLTQLFASDLLIHRLASELYAARNALDGKDSGSLAKAIGQQAVQNLTLQGIRRLDDKDLVMFIHYMAIIPTVATPAQCKVIFSTDNLDPTTEFRVVAASQSMDFGAYLALIRKAIFAELAGTPYVATVTAQQKTLSEKAFQDALFEALSSYPPADIDRISSAYDNLDAAPDADACDGYRLMFKTMYEMEGMPGTWFRRSFVSELAEEK